MQTVLFVVMGLVLTATAAIPTKDCGEFFGTSLFVTFSTGNKMVLLTYTPC